MTPPAESRTVSISIRRSPDDVYRFVADIEKFPVWSAMARKVTREGDAWLFETADATARVRFAPRNEYRILDHTVTLPGGEQVYVPLRVVANGADHSEVLFTVFRRPAMTDRDFEDDIGLVLRDLASLKRVLETG